MAICLNHIINNHFRMNHYLDELVQSSKRILLLQGPIGHFFTDLSAWLVGQGKTVYKINFNGGD